MKNNDLRKLLKAAEFNDSGENATGMEGEMAPQKNGKGQGAWSKKHGAYEPVAQANKSTGNKTAGSKSGHGYFRGLLSGTFISESLILKDIRYSVLVALLAVIFIANRFNAERVEREIIVLEQEVRDMRSESLSVSAELGSVSRQSEITELVKARGLGLQELREPPFRIVVHE